METWTLNEDVFPIENEDTLPETNSKFATENRKH